MSRKWSEFRTTLGITPEDAAKSVAQTRVQGGRATPSKTAQKLLKNATPLEEWIARVPGTTPAEIDFYRRYLAELERGAKEGWPRKAKLRTVRLAPSTSKKR